MGHAPDAHCLTGKTAEPILREYEEHVLDLHHLTFKSFWNLPEGHRFYSLLAALDSFALPQLGIFASPGDAGVTRAVKFLEEGLGQALRWCATMSSSGGLQPTSSRQAIEAAGELLLYASQYAQIADFHRAYGRGLVSLSVDPKAKRVRFTYRSNEARIQDLEGFDESVRLTNATGLQNRRLRKLIRSGHNIGEQFQLVGHHCDDGRVRITDVSALNEGNVIVFVNELMRGEVSRFAAETSLVGFTFGELVLFWSALLRVSIAAQSLFFKYVDGGKPQNECYPVQVMNRDEFGRMINELSGLTARQSDTIVDRLQFRHKDVKADVFLQPLLCNGEIVAWSTWVILGSRFVRNMLKLMAKSPPLKPAADLLIGGRASVLARRIGLVLASKGYQYCLNREISTRNEEGEIDVLAWTSRRPRELLLVEAKACLEADEVNEVNALTTELLKGQEQLRRNTRILQALGLHEKRKKFAFVPWDQVTDVYGIVVSQAGLPNSRFKHDVYPACALSSMAQYFRPSDWKSPSRIRDALARQPWLDTLREMMGGQLYHEIPVGDVTYELPTLELDQTEDSSGSQRDK